MRHQPADISTYSVKHIDEFGVEGFYKRDLEKAKNFAK